MLAAQVCTREYGVDLSNPREPELVESKGEPVTARVSHERVTIGNSVGVGERFEVSRVVAPAYYYLGIIDILQDWNYTKTVRVILNAIGCDW